MAVAVEGFVEQAFGRTDRIGTVNDDHVIAAGRRLFYPLDAINKVQFRARVVVGTTQLREIDFGQAGDPFIDLNLLCLFHFRVF